MGATLGVLAFRNVDFNPRTGLNASSGVVGSSEFNSLANSIGRTDRDWMDFNCSGIIESVDVNIHSQHSNHACH